MKFTQEYADHLFAAMLGPEERSLCPVYCMYTAAGFFARTSDLHPGFATCTSTGRILMAKSFLFQKYCAMDSCLLSSLKDIKIKKNIFGQYIVTFTIPNIKRNTKIKIAVSPKVIGCDLPNQAQNTDTLINTLNRYI